MRRKHSTMALDALLGERAGAMPVWQVRALFLGALASTNMRLGPHHLLSCVLGDEDPKLDSAEEAQALVRALGALWNDLTESARDGVHLSDVVVPAKPSIQQLRAFAERRYDELNWFIRGIDAGGDDPADFGNEGVALFRKLAEVSAYFERYLETPEDAAEQTSVSELRESARALQGKTRVAEGILGDLLEVGRVVRANALSAFEQLSKRGRTDDGVRAGARKIGRNDPCPCGSAKKWKRCCGAAPATEH